MIAGVIGALLLAFALAEMQENVSSSSVYSFADMSEVDGGSSRLIRSADAVAMELQTVGLESNAPYTVWWVVFNKPENCSDACNGDDLFNVDAMAAELHLVVRSHGPTDLSRLYEQLSTFEPGPVLGGTCEVCQDNHFAVHQPVDR
ncbi:MAG: hypothetical protein WD273_06970 [Trueperaceae bacterium]